MASYSHTILTISTETDRPKQTVFTQIRYGKCPKILYTKVADKVSYANSLDSDQTEGAV